MFKQLLKIIALFCAFSGAALAQSVNGGWATSYGDMLFLVKSTKNQVIAVDLTSNKTPRYLFLGSMNGNQLSLKTRDGAVTLDATVSDSGMAGTLAESGQSPQDFTANLYFAYKGSSYDGVWQIDGKEEYFLYATLTVKGVSTVLVPYFAFTDGQEPVHDVFMGTPAKANSAGKVIFAGLSVLDYSVLKLTLPSKSTANGSFVETNGSATSFTATKKYAVTKQSGQT